MRLYMLIFIEKFDQSHLAVDLRTEELVSNASAQLIPDYTVNFSDHFYRSNWT